MCALKRVMDQRGLTHLELARLTRETSKRLGYGPEGLSKSTIYKLATGRRGRFVSGRVVDILSETLGVEPRALFRRAPRGAP